MAGQIIKQELGGGRVGSGGKISVDLRTYNRSSHNLSYVWRNTQAPGTLVPFLCKVGLPGDTMDIDLSAHVLTHPTVGPLFGSFKLQMDVYQCPIRLYQAQLHNNKLGIGMDMSKIKLPQIDFLAKQPVNNGVDPNLQHMNPSCIHNYLGIKGFGTISADDQINGMEDWNRSFNAIPYLAYWDIYKNYYANNQEEIGVVVHTNNPGSDQVIFRMTYGGLEGGIVDGSRFIGGTYVFTEPLTPTAGTQVTIQGSNLNVNNIKFQIEDDFTWYSWTDVFATMPVNSPGQMVWQGANVAIVSSGQHITAIRLENLSDGINSEIQLYTFPLKNIDNMREDILAAIKNQNAFRISNNTYAPYGLSLQELDDRRLCTVMPQEGLAIKTYQSDIYNNWLNSEWIDGENGVNEISAVDTSGGSFTMDALNLAMKVYRMMNRIVVTGGSYYDWLKAVYTHEPFQSCETPIYEGGYSQNIMFQEVISNSATETEPLGTIAGRGTLSGNSKGGRIKVKIHEPAYVIGIVSITPRLDYSQGNEWDMNLLTMNDFHKPALDGIGFQDLVTDQMAAWDTRIDGNTGQPVYKSAGKQPAWINYMTDFNRNFGNFAIETNEMFMVLNRRYTPDWQAMGTLGQIANIQDLTTYIDPTKFNYAFAQTDLSAQNFWVQIGVNCVARRKMSAKIIPNL